MADDHVILSYDLAPSARVASQLQRQMADLERGLKFKGPFGPMVRETKDFGSELDRANQRVITLGASFAVLSTSIRTLRDIVRSTIEVEKAFADINAVFGLSAQGLDKFSKQLFNTARETSQAFEKAASAAKEFSRQGLSAEETIKRTRDALILTRLANLDVAASVETLTASINGFQKSALTSTAIVNKLATVDAAFAVSSKDLAEGLARAGAAASDAGVSFDQLIGLITAAQQTTARGGAVIGNSLKTIFTRVERRDTIDAFESLGVAVRDTQGNVLSALPLLQNFAKVYDNLGGSVKKQAAELVGGVFQINILKAVLGDLAKAQGIAAQATGVSNSATDEAIKRNEALNQTLDAMLARLGATSKQIGANVGSQTFAGPLKSLLGSLQNNPITAALEDASGKAESIGGKIAQELMQGMGGALVYGLGPLVLGALSKVVVRTSKGLLDDFGGLTKLTSQGQAQARVQSEVVALYRAGGAALQQQLAAMSSLTEKAALLQRLLASGGSNPNSVAAMTGAMMSAGYRGRGFPKAAGGYVPIAEEAAAIRAGVGGAPASAKPVFLPDFNRGGGKRGIVANTSEFIVPNMAGGGAGIFNQEMVRKYGLPKGATPVAASGHIPFAAFGSMMGMPAYGSPFDYPQKILQNAQVVPGGMTPSATGQGFGQYGGYQRPSVYVPGTSMAATGQGFGQYTQQISSQVSPAAMDKLNGLFKTLATFPDKPAAYDTAEEIKKVAKSFDTLSRSQVLTRLKEDMAALAFRSRIVGDQSRKAAVPGVPSVEIGGMAAAHDYDAFLRRSEAASRIRQFAGRSGGPSMQQIESVLPANEVIEPFGRLAPSLVDNLRRGPRPSVWQRLKGMRPNSQTASMAAMFALPFAGSMIDEGRGGTGGGMARGAASSGLTAAGFGASTGFMLGGPMGAAIGGIGGGILGGAFGAVKKINKSFEELAAEIQESNARIGERINSVNEVFRLDEDLKNAQIQLQQARASKAPEQAIRGRLYDIRGAQRAALSRLDPKTRAIMDGRFTNSNAQADALEANVLEQSKRRLGDDLRSSMKGAIESKMFLNLGGAYEDKDIARARDGIVPVLSRLSNPELDKLSQMNRENPRATIGEIGSLAGLDPELAKDLTDRYDTYFKLGMRRPNNALAELFQESIQQAIRKAAAMNMDDAEASTNADRTNAEIEAKRMSKYSSDLELLAKMVGITAGGDLRINQARQQVKLNSPMLTDLERLNMSGGFERANIATEFGTERETRVMIGQKQLLDVLRASGGATSQARSVIEGVGSIGEAERLRSLLKTTDTPIQTTKGDDLIAVLDELIESLTVLDATEKVQLRVSRESNKLRADEIQFFHTAAGARMQYGGAARKAGIGLADSLNRNDIPDVLAKGFLETNVTGLENDFNAKRIDSRTYQGRRLGISANMEALERINGGRAVRAMMADPSMVGGKDLTGDHIRSGLFGEARQAGIEGKAGKSFLGGFRSEIEGAKRDLLDFSEAGARTAQSLHGNFTDFWTQFSTDATRGKDAFKGFVASVLTDASRMLASKAFTAALSAIPGFGVPTAATGGELAGNRFKFAAGGKVPALLTGGEIYIGPRAAKQIGYDKLRSINAGRQGLASGGMADVAMVRGGSGVKDDVPANLPQGSFIIKKSTAQRLGPNYFKALAGGRVQHRFLGGLMGTALGGALTGAVVGGGLGYVTGGKQGAIGGALLGGIAGGLYGYNSGGPRMDPATGQRATLSLGTKAALGLGASAGLGMLGGALTKPDKEKGPIGLDQVPAFRAGHEAWDVGQMKRGAGQHAFLEMNPQGGYSLAGVGLAPATRRWDTGGEVSSGLTMSAPMPSSSSGAGMQVSVKIEINNNGQVSSKTSANGDGAFGTDMANKIDKQVRGIVQEEFVRASRSDGFFAQRSRYMNS